jgi:hypothetical protein
MPRRLLCLLYLLSCLCVGTSLVAYADATAPVAYVYVTSNYGYPGNTNRIVGYAVDANGKLTQVPGSPFPNSNVSSMAVNGKYLFASSNANNNAGDIDTYLLGNDGSLKRVDTTNVEKFPDSTCASPGALLLDHTGVTLYSFTYNADCSGTDDAYQSLDIVKTSGSLKYLSETFPNLNTLYPLTFIGNNVFAYEASCIFDIDSIEGFKRDSNGSLAQVSIDATLPTAPKDEMYCPSFATADRTNHLALDMHPVVRPGDPAPTGGTGDDQIATYTVDESNGNLMTTSTEKNMPRAAVVHVRTMSMAPSGKLLAVGGTKGLQIFHFNGGDPLTVDTGRLTTDEIDQVFWDNDNHLYAIGRSAGKLFVFTVTPTSATEAKGSPYTITQPTSLIVAPK